MDVHYTAVAETVSRPRPQHGWHISIELMDYGRSLHGCGRDCVKAEISARLAHVQLSK
ncbi:hypothetical protein J6590_063374 [Homalodisca vitripennis]|nr:hypothetical protein J6590_063374 [Homalodisca vitripennis]